jgi:hypothetical protein
LPAPGTAESLGVNKDIAINAPPLISPAAPASPPGPVVVLEAISVRVVKVKGRYQVRVYDLATGLLKFVLSPVSKSYPGKLSVQLADLDGDGTPDLVVLAQRGKKTQSYTYRGSDGSPLWT